MKLDTVIAVRKNKMVYRDGDCCLKVFGEGYSKADILNEALNQARVEETGLAIPKIREVTVINGQWAIVFDYIEGKTLAQLMLESPEKQEEYLDWFVKMQLEIQKKTCPLLTKLKDKMKRKINLTAFDATTRYDLHTRLDAMPHQAQLCHGDFNPSNIIISRDKTPYMIDWAHATQGNGAADAARTYLLFWLAGEAEIAEKYLTLFCRASLEEKTSVQRWLPIVAASQSVKGNAEEKELLTRWVNVVDYQ